MICDQCSGNGIIPIRDDQGRRVGVSVCATCNGCCRNYCCSGADCQPPAHPPYDPVADMAGSWWLAMSEIGERVKAGEPVPEFMLSAKDTAP